MNDGYAIQKKLPISEATRARNPALFGAVGAVSDQVTESDQIPALDHRPKARSGSARSLVTVHIISVRRKLLDSDNCQAGAKGLRDAIAQSLGLDDNSPAIEWEYSQAKTSGRQGTIVHIQTV